MHSTLSVLLSAVILQSPVQAHLDPASHSSRPQYRATTHERLVDKHILPLPRVPPRELKHLPSLSQKSSTTCPPLFHSCA